MSQLVFVYFAYFVVFGILIFYDIVMNFFDVQITTDMGEVVVVQVVADDRQEAEMTAISMVESGHAGTVGRSVVDCFAM
jgi:hypothetical protein